MKLHFIILKFLYNLTTKLTTMENIMIYIKSYFTGFFAEYAFKKEDNSLNPRLATTFK